MPSYIWYLVYIRRYCHVDHEHLYVCIFVGVVMWTMNMVIFLNFWLMMIWWNYANLEHAEHVKSCYFHQHSSHGRNDNCSLCSRHQQLLSSHLFTHTHESTITVVLSLLRKTLKCIQILFLVFLILLAGDVEINPGPGKKTVV